MCCRSATGRMQIVSPTITVPRYSRQRGDGGIMRSTVAQPVLADRARVQCFRSCCAWRRSRCCSFPSRQRQPAQSPRSSCSIKSLGLSLLTHSSSWSTFFSSLRSVDVDACSAAEPAVATFLQTRCGLVRCNPLPMWPPLTTLGSACMSSLYSSLQGRPAQLRTRLFVTGLVDQC